MEQVAVHGPAVPCEQTTAGQLHEVSARTGLFDPLPTTMPKTTTVPTNTEATILISWVLLGMILMMTCPDSFIGRKATLGHRHPPSPLRVHLNSAKTLSL